MATTIGLTFPVSDQSDETVQIELGSPLELLKELDLKQMLVPELKKLAKGKDIDISGFTKKEDIVQAISDQLEV